MKPSLHIPVMLGEVLHWLDVKAGQTIVDGTMGGGGHASLLLDAVGPTGRVIGLDQDPAAIERAESRFAGRPLSICQSNFCEIPEVLQAVPVNEVDGIVLDLGLSSDQLADHGRGFSFQAEGELDLRFNPDLGVPAWRLLQRLSADHLADILFRFGEERYGRRIARRIVERIETGPPLRTSADLAELVRRAVPFSRQPQRLDPATRTFQALRIAVNDELRSLEIALKRCPDCLAPGGRLVVISFHSLEDRRVKSAFRDDDRLEVLTRKSIRPMDCELAENPRARSAHLRRGSPRADRLELTAATGESRIRKAKRAMGSGTKVALGVIGVLVLMVAGLVWMRISFAATQPSISTLKKNDSEAPSALLEPPVVVQRPFLSGENRDVTPTGESPAPPASDSVLAPDAQEWLAPPLEQSPKVAPGSVGMPQFIERTWRVVREPSERLR